MADFIYIRRVWVFVAVAGFSTFQLVGRGKRRPFWCVNVVGRDDLDRNARLLLIRVDR